MNEILIIGGSGYIGTVLTEHFLEHNYNVKSFDCFVYKNNQFVLPYLGRKSYKHYYGDICSLDDLEKVIKNSHNVVLLSGLVGDPITKKYPNEASKINDIGVENVIKICSKYVERFVFISTCSNYGFIKK